MRVELFPFQRKAVADLRTKVAMALGNYSLHHAPQVVSFTAPTGSGKTVIMSSLIENIYWGTETYEEQQEAIFVWLSDSPSLNLQSKDKIDTMADRIRLGQCVVIDEASFDMETLEDGHIYFLNTQKLGKAGKLGQHSDGRQYTIWETLKNTAERKADRLYFIIDEAHRGMQGKDAGKATSIMQRFLKGSEKDHLPAMPVVIGMSATPARFNALVEGTTSTIHKTVITSNEVRQSGLLKDRIILTYPKDASVNNDMAILQAAADEWKKKCDHWEQYCREQHYAMVNPVFVIQVQNTSGSDVTATDLADAVERIQERTGYHFTEGQVVHTFGQTASIALKSLTIPYAEPSSIADNKTIRVVFFKENLSTGWDCPRAETMMSFRHADDATYIAQLLGRMVRTPLQMHITVDDYLNDVRLYLPHFNSENVKTVVEELQNSEGGDIPTEIDNEEYENPSYVIWTVAPHKRTPAQAPGQVSLFDQPGGSVQQPLTGPAGQAAEPASPVKEVHPQETPTPLNVMQQPKPVMKAEPAADTPEPVQTRMATLFIDRDAVVRFINQLAPLTYEVRTVRISQYLPSLLKLARLLTHTNIYQTAIQDVQNEIVDMIRAHAETLKKEGKYGQLSANVLQFKLSQQIFDVFGQTVDNYAIHGFFTTSDSDLDRQLRQADAQLGNFHVSDQYGSRYYDEEDPNAYKIDVILFAADTECMNQLGQYAEAKFHDLNDQYRLHFTMATDWYRKQYHDIIADGDMVSKHSFRLPEVWQVKADANAKGYDNHLFVDDKTGLANIKLNSWEEGVLAEEAKRSDFVCWLRNPPRTGWALCIPYELNGEVRSAYPDFVIVRYDPKIGYIFDILEPHAADFADNLAKAKGFARYAQEEPRVGRIQMIRMSKDAAGQSRFKRLDLAKGSTRNKVLAAQTNSELDHLFDTDGFFD